MEKKPWVMHPGRNGPYSQHYRGSNLFETEIRFYYEYYVRGAKSSVSLICADIDNKSIYDKVQRWNCLLTQIVTINSNIYASSRNME